MLRFDECGSSQKVEAYLLRFGSPNDLVVGLHCLRNFFFKFLTPSQMSWGLPCKPSGKSGAVDCVSYMLSTGKVDRGVVELVLEVCKQRGSNNLLLSVLSEATSTDNAKRAKFEKQGPGLVKSECANLASLRYYFCSGEGHSPNDSSLLVVGCLEALGNCTNAPHQSLTVFESAVYLGCKPVVVHLLGLLGRKRVSTEVLTRTLQMESGKELFPLVAAELKSRNQPFDPDVLGAPAVVAAGPMEDQPTEEAFGLKVVGSECKNLGIVQDYLEHGGSPNDLLMWEGLTKTLFSWASGFRAAEVTNYLLQQRGHEIHLESLFESRDFALRQHSFKLAAEIEAVIARRRMNEL
ncbi:hypothetical protein BASA81_001089 [Batrachochytrium salamandrivorans]|nr:hypothetical protein BASA81_001089 [Batrachochytrium salamandrivorans]